jgi:hypothetical protein
MHDQLVSMPKKTHGGKTESSAAQGWQRDSPYSSLTDRSRHY